MAWRLSFKPGYHATATLTKDEQPVTINDENYTDLTPGSYVIEEKGTRFVVLVQEDDTIKVCLPQNGEASQGEIKVYSGDLAVSPFTLKKLGVSSLHLAHPGTDRLNVIFGHSGNQDYLNSRYTIYRV